MFGIVAIVLFFVAMFVPKLGPFDVMLLGFVFLTLQVTFGSGAFPFTLRRRTE